MYEIRCEYCGKISFHATRSGAERLAGRHADRTAHPSSIRAMTDA